MNKLRPTGFIAVCQCRKTIGARDADRTPSADIGKTLGAWLYNGCTVIPQFGGELRGDIESCVCDKSQAY